MVLVGWLLAIREFDDIKGKGLCRMEKRGQVFDSRPRKKACPPARLPAFQLTLIIPDWVLSIHPAADFASSLYIEFSLYTID